MVGPRKELLPWRGRTLLEHTLQTLLAETSPVVVVAGRGRVLPRIDPRILVIHDRQEDLGPLSALLLGWEVLPVDVEAAFVVSCDLPLLQGRFIRGLDDRRGDADIVVVQTADGHVHPLAAIYTRGVIPLAEKLLRERRNAGPKHLLERALTRRVLPHELDPVDLNSIRSFNTPQEWREIQEFADD
jgi:molybdopterin-guanine dinucleotide biosynthesis protein A